MPLKLLPIYDHRSACLHCWGFQHTPMTMSDYQNPSPLLKHDDWMVIRIGWCIMRYTNVLRVKAAAAVIWVPANGLVTYRIVCA